MIILKSIFSGSVFFLLLQVVINFKAFAQTQSLHVYTSRNEQLVKPIFDLYMQKTGVKITYQTGQEAPLITRLEREGAKTQADIFMTVDAGNLWIAQEKGILEPYRSEALQQNIPAHLQSNDGSWYGFSVRARTIVYSTDRVKKEQLSTYEDLADAKWRGKLCLRTSKKVYNQSLVAMLIKDHGLSQVENVVKGWVRNLATRVFPNDTKLIEAIAAGQCDVGIVNTYYLGRIQEKKKIPVAIFWPNQKNSESLGVHVNVSGAGIVKHAKNKKEAQKFMDWLSTPEAQGLFAELNHEFPANPKVPSSALVQSWGDFKQNTNNLSFAGKLQGEAIKLMDRVEYF